MARRPSTFPMLFTLVLFAAVAAAAADAPDVGEEAALDGEELLSSAWEAQTRGEHDEAEARYRSAHDAFSEIGDTRGMRLIAINLGLLLAELGRLDEAVVELTAAVSLAGGAVDRSVPVATRLLLVDVYLDHRRPVDALIWADAALAAAAATDDAGFIAAPVAAYLRTSRAIADDPPTILGALEHVDRRLANVSGYEGKASIPLMVFSRGVQALEVGDAASALAHMEDATAAAAAMGAGDPDLLAGLAIVALQVGQDDRARRALESALTLPDGDTTPLLSARAALQWREGWYAAGVQSTRRSLERAERDGDEQLISELRLVLAARLEALGELDAARVIHEVVLDGLEADDEVEALTEELVLQRLRLATVDARLGRWEEALRQARRSLAENRDPFQQAGGGADYGSRSAAAGAFLVIARVDMEQGDGEEARASLKAAAALLDHAPVAHASVGYLALEQSDTERARQVFEELEQAGAASWFSAHGLGVALWRGGDIEGAREALERAVERLGDEAPPPHLFLPAPLRVHADLIALLVEAGDHEAAFAATTRARSAGRADAAIPDLAALQSALPEDASARLYLVTPQEIWTWVIAEGWLSVHHQDLDRRELVENIDAYLAEIGAPPRGSRRLARAWRDPASTLYGDLVAPVADQLKDSPTLVLLPHGPLDDLPFAALLDPEADEVLAQRHTLITAPGQLALDRPDPDLPRKPLALLAGGAEVGGAVTSVARLFRKPVHLEPVTEDALRVQLPSAEVIHLHTACELNPILPGASRIVMAPDHAHDGLLTAEDLASLPLRASLVTVVGCSTSRLVGPDADEHTPWPAPARLTLATSFLHAGAPAVLLGADSVDPSLLDAFYGTVARHGPAVALQRAQARMFAEEVHPYHWADWTVVGDAGL
jgi:tetratricopeptide (TPR) repeat protein